MSLFLLLEKSISKLFHLYVSWPCCQSFYVHVHVCFLYRRRSKTEFLALPTVEEYCRSVDVDHGKWIICGLCDHRINTRSGREFTIAKWTEHIAQPTHVKKEANKNEIKTIQAKIASKDPSLTKAQRQFYKMESKSATSIKAFFPVKKTQKPPSEPSSTVESTSAQTEAGSTVDTSTEGSMMNNVPLAASDTGDVTMSVNITPKRCTQYCEGLFHNYRPAAKKSMSAVLTVYGETCVVAEGSNYKFGMVGNHFQVFAKECTGSNPVNRSTGTKKIAHWNCRSCFELHKKTGFKISQVLRDRVKKISKAMSVLDRKDELSDFDYEDLKNILKGEDKYWSERGLAFRDKVRREVNYYESVKKLGRSQSTSTILSSNGNVPSKDKFFLRFQEFYNKESAKPSDKQHLIYALLETMLAKESGIKNPKYSERILNFQLATYSLSKKTGDFVSANFNLASDRHIRRVKADRRGPAVINISDEDLVSHIVKHIDKIRVKSGDSSGRVVISLGVDATVVVKGWQYLPDKNVVVGGAYPNHWLEVNSTDKDDIKNFIKQCLAGEKGVVAEEIKVAVLSFQNTPPGISPYYVIKARPQTINESNSFATDVMSLCVEAAKKAGNVAVVNDATDGVSCEVKSNFEQQNRFLCAESDQVSFTDPNHNGKNMRYQLIGGSGISSAVIGKYTFDPMLLKLAGVPRELVRIDDYASDALVLKLASLKRE